MRLSGMTRALLSASCAASLVLAPFAAFAATTTPAFQTPSPITPAAPASYAGLTSCFNYYQFGSIEAVLSSHLASAAAGSVLAIDANIENKNDYPVVATDVYARVFRDTTGTNKNVDGPDVVDYFPIVQNLTLKAHEKKLVTYYWKVPADADPGPYRIVTFVEQANRFNFLGLTFTDDITGPSLNFSVVNDATGGVRFDRTAATLAGASYRFAAYAPLLGDAQKDVTINAPIVSTRSVATFGTVTWKTYSWDGSNPASLLDSKTQKFAIGAHASTTLTYTVSDTTHTVYYVTAEFDGADNGSKSIAAFRFTRPNINTPRIAAVEAMQYPLTKGALVFACVHSSGQAPSKASRLDVSIETLPIFGLFPITLSTKSYTGAIPGEISALTVPATFPLSSFQVVARLSQNGALVDQVTIPYTCNAFGTCKSFLWVWVTLAGLLGAGVLAWYVWRRRRHQVTQYSAPESRSMIPPPPSP